MLGPTVPSNVAAAPPGSSFNVKTKLSDGVSAKKSDGTEEYARLLRVPEAERAPAREEARQESVGTLDSKEATARQESGAIDETSSLSTSSTGGHPGPSLELPESGFVPVATVPRVDLKKLSEPAEDEVRYHWVEPDDSLRWICLKYKDSTNDLWRANGFTGSNLKSAPRKLVIPKETVPSM